MALRKDGPNIKPHADKFKCEPGVKYECIKSASPAYRVGDVVDCYQNDKGWKCLRGRDGLEDICSLVVSAFRMVDATKPSHLSVVS